MNGRITNRPAGACQRLALPRIGRIKVGYKDERGLPRSTDYFVAAGKYAGLFTRAYGEKPSVIQVVFPSDDAAQVCNERYEYRDDEGKLVAAGDGSVFQVWDGKQYRELSADEYPNMMQSVERRYPNRRWRETGDGWEAVLTLDFIIPCVRGVAGVWRFTTKGSASTIPQIRDVFDEMLRIKGYVKGIIFDLSVEYSKSWKPGVKSRFPVVAMVPNESEDNLRKVKRAYEPVKLEVGKE